MKRFLFLGCLLWLGCDHDSKRRTPYPWDFDAATNGGRDAGTNPDDEDDDDSLPVTHTECLTETSFDLASALKLQPPPIMGDGTVEVPLSPQGCVRWVRTVEGGRVRAFSIRRWSGYLGFESDGGIPDYNNLKFRELEFKYIDAKVAADGSLEVTFDANGDDKPDGRLSESYAGDQIARQEFTRFSPSNGAVAERRTLTSKDASTIHFKVERSLEGSLATVADFDAPAAQRQNIACYSPPPAGANDTVPCSDDYKKMVRDQLKTSIERAVACFDKYEDGWSIEQFQLFLFYQNYGDTIEVECFQSNEYVGEMDVGTKGPKLRVNVELFKCEQSNFIDSTLFHEVLHRLRGPHDENDNELGPQLAGFGPRANAYTDSIRGCEELCFGMIKNVCSCAACFQSDTCDSRCGSLAGCVTHDPSGKATMSEAVGALCRDPAPVPATQKKSTWHSTMMDCESNCAFGAAQCKSYSVSCDDSCQ